ncbi:MAG: alanine/glycine:cation symporter family protein [Actinomyces urogenitalis]|uniref:Alanine:cation symporter family protein n=2 Tax=Actinomyces urogenitalis TaxID=103621 RepID=A0A2I1KTS3_9ACTO|nr:alanine/glycine:cation symporter family protein [Actinomyces urogenitalis]ETJ02876.1 MAG: AGCS family alanine or glycine:sodium (Na+) or proton (H+) symporter [Actinomyces urogenitalis DORA_12]MDU0971879.1 alanine/glycine:cation symporter family protein [Actinomyces urogenitalis]PKY99029.1 alanine:cation symporter family protein [Actinomyces urogenitalis]
MSAHLATSLTSILTDSLSGFESFVSGRILIWLLIAAGAYLTVCTRGVQLRLLARPVALVAHSRHQRGSLSSFQAFVIGLGGRVGTGNIAGVALAVTLGGPGALLWMWVVALLGMATSFAESTLAQVFKVRGADGIFRGGPAYYMERGLALYGRRGLARLGRWMGLAFAAMLVFSYGLIFPMVQSNTIAVTVASSHGVATWVTALVLMTVTAPILLAGMRAVAKVTEWLVPVMALAYLAVVAVVIIVSAPRVPGVLADVVAGAFNLRAGLAGTGGGLFATFLNGVKRGLFSNEAGQGSSPNGAATADVAHPVVQGLIQALGVFIDTIIICTATGLTILLASPAVYTPGVEPAWAETTLVQHALADALPGAWVVWFMTFLVITFAYSSVLGYSSFAEVNVSYLGGGRRAGVLLRLAMTAATGLGAVVALDLAWVMADVALALMTILNLVAVLWLGRWVFATLRDYDGQRRSGVAEPAFVGVGNALLPMDVPGDVWTAERARERVRTLDEG